MLEVATINAGQLKLKIDNFDLHTLVYEIADSLQPTTDKTCSKYLMD